MGVAGDLAASMAALNYSVADDDQRFWTSLYFASRRDAARPRIVLDHESDLFVGMAGLSPWVDLAFDPHARRYKFRHTAGLPVVVHFNGGKGDVGAFFAALSGGWCPTTRYDGCALAAAAAPSALAFLAALLVGRAVVSGVAALMGRVGYYSKGSSSGSGWRPVPHEGGGGKFSSSADDAH